ncbi:hypothetical protein [Enhygromyxa salina]|uniref:hypothetical protein n=1 Tax=Enhygromyxa salina TaxID=215803 RepID=UPI000698A289|nr:hypothetical protein [Enhygromyxa salina]
MSDPVARIEAVLEELDELHQGLARPHVRESQLLEKLRNRLEPLLEEHRPPPLDRGADEWVTELLATARYDLQAAQTLAASKGDHAPTVAMLLQMVFEKLAKAYLARTDWPAFVKHRRSHAVAKRFAQFLKLNWQLRPNVGPHSSKVLGWVVRLTEAHPALAKNGPHLEYPWEAHGRVCGPTRDLDIVNELRDAKSGAAPHLLRFAGHFIENFDRILG